MDALSLVRRASDPEEHQKSLRALRIAAPPPPLPSALVQMNAAGSYELEKMKSRRPLWCKGGGARVGAAFVALAGEQASKQASAGVYLIGERTGGPPVRPSVH